MENKLEEYAKLDMSQCQCLKLQRENERLKSVLEKSYKALEFYSAELSGRCVYEDIRKMMKQTLNKINEGVDHEQF